MLGNKKGQSALEYGLIIAVVVIALLAINVYMKKGVEGRLKESTDQIGRQFDSGTFETSWQTSSTGNTTTEESRDGTGETTLTTTQAETVTRDEYDTFGNDIPDLHIF